MRSYPLCRSTLASLGVIVMLLAGVVHAQTNEGAWSCEECHDIEYETWQATRHATAFEDFHEHPDVEDFVQAVGGASDPRENPVCAACHYTMARSRSSSAIRARSGPSCEGCHGPSSGWLDLHRDYGGRSVRPKDESEEHKRARIEGSIEAGMVWPFMRYDLAAACTRCHGSTGGTLDRGAMTALIDAGHPTDEDFELIRYSQGTVRHRYYPPDIDINQELGPAELARFFVTGQAAQLVASTEAMTGVSHPQYLELQRARADAARESLALLSGVPEAAALIASPSEAAARKLVDAIAEQDLSGVVSPLLPASATYK